MSDRHAVVVAAVITGVLGVVAAVLIAVLPVWLEDDPAPTQAGSGFVAVDDDADPPAEGDSGNGPLGVAAPTSAPAPTPAPAATAAPTETPLPTNTPVPPPTATAVPTATVEPTPTAVPAEGTVLYDSASDDFDSWRIGGGWLAFDGMLVNDGSGGTASLQSGATDMRSLVVEVDLTVTQPGLNQEAFIISVNGVEFRLDKLNNCWQGATQMLLYVNGERVDDNVCAGGHPQDFHTYRLMIDDNNASVEIDGTLVLEATDNSLLRGRTTGVKITCDQEVQVEVSGVRVFAGENQ